ncbi:MAG: efflux RND transporter permease subunit [Pirellulales bacterium]|nr:efflux RND transporter permease subunit [Pirellulales bacterium]
MATLFAKHRAAVAVLILAISVIALWGHVRGQSDRTRVGPGQLDEDETLLRDVTEQFDLQSTDCFLLVEVDDLYSADCVAALRDIVDAVRELDYVESAIWMDDVPTLNVFGLPEPLLPVGDLSSDAFRDAEERARAHPLVYGQLVSADSKTLLVQIRFDWLEVENDAAVTTDLAEAVRRTASRHAGVDAKVRLTGRVPLFVTQNESFDHNNRKFRIIGHILPLVIGIFLFRGITPVVIVTLAPALGIFRTTGLMELLELNKNILTNVVLPVLISMVGLTDGVHLMVYIRRRLSDGASPLDASSDAIRHVGLACLLTSVTTAIGFGSLLLCESQFIRDFGLACSLGVLVTFVAVITSIPLASSTRFARNLDSGQRNDFVGHGMKRLDRPIDWILRHARLVAITGIAVTIACALISTTLRPDAMRRNGLPVGSESAQALMHCDRAMGGIDFARIVIEWPQRVPDDSAKILAAVADVEALVANEPLLRHPMSIRRVLSAFSDQDADMGARMSFLALLPSELRSALFNAASRRTLVTVRVQDLGLARYAPVFRDMERDLVDLESNHPGFRFTLTGQPVVGGRDLAQIVYDLAISLGTASLVILVVMAVVYRSLRIGLITLVPNLFPLVLTAAVLALTGQSLTVTSVCAFTICIGIAVDDTIHFLTRFQQELATGGDVHGAIRRSMISVGTALVMTTLVMVAGFATVLTSEIPAQQIFAAMACLTIAAALIGDLVFLPAMLATWVRSADEKSDSSV